MSTQNSEGAPRSGLGLTPPEIVNELSRHIVAQEQAKKAVAIALRSRWRRLQVPKELQPEITPKNILMMGPTGVGKTEIARRLAKLVDAPFVKVEASKFTEVGYIGRDVESIVRDLADAAYNIVRSEQAKRNEEKADAEVGKRILAAIRRQESQLLQSEDGEGASEETNVAEDLPPGILNLGGATIDLSDQAGPGGAVPTAHIRGTERFANAVEPCCSDIEDDELLDAIRRGEHDEMVIRLEVEKKTNTHVEIFGPPGFSEVEGQIKEMFSQMGPKSRVEREVTVREAKKLLREEVEEGLLDSDSLKALAISRAESQGIIFIDEIDKICASEKKSGSPDVSREGVQRDLLPLVEGSNVSTRYGMLRTDHVLFIASGAFHFSKPSDLMPEFQGRFPIRVELESLTADHFYRILTEPAGALPLQYRALLEAEKVRLVFEDDALREISSTAARINSDVENIGARRLHTIIEKVVEEVSFAASDFAGQDFVITKEYVQGVLRDLQGVDDYEHCIL